MTTRGHSGSCSSSHTALNLQALLIFPFLNLAKDSGQVAHAERLTESFVQVVFHAAKPARRSLFWGFNPAMAPSISRT